MHFHMQCVLLGVLLLSLLGLATTEQDIDTKDVADNFDTSELEIFKINSKKSLDKSDMGEVEELMLVERWFVTRPPRRWYFWIAIPIPWWLRWLFGGRRWLVIFWCWRHFWIWGDPHYATLDGVMYDFMGTCTYTLATTVDDSVPQFSVYSDTWRATKRMNTNHVSSTKSVIVDVYGYRIQVGQGQRVVVNGLERNLPLFFGDNVTYVTVFQQPTDVAIITDFGLYVTFDGSFTMSVNVPDQFMGKIRGLIGNYDDDPNNDFMKPDGTLADNATDFGNSWKYDALSDADCEPDAGNSDSKCTKSQQTVVDAQCSGLDDPTGAFAPGHGLVPPDMARESCEFDMCSDFKDKKLLCSTYALYASLIEHFGVTINWRTDTFCPMDCGANAHYVDSVTPCVSTCQNTEADADCVPDPEDETDNVLTTSGCVCDDGYVREGLACIAESMCGCVDSDNVYHKVGEYWSDCGEICHCKSKDDIVCVTISACPPGWTCVTQPDDTTICVCNTPACPKTCAVSTDAVLRNQYKIGTLLPNKRKARVAYTDGPVANIACRIMIQTKITKKVVDYVNVNIGSRPNKPGKFYRTYAFDFRRTQGVTQKGYLVSGREDIDFPPDPFSFSTSDFSVTIDQLTNSTWKIDVNCGSTHMLALTYGVPGDAYVNMVVDSPEQWSDICYDDI